MSITETLKSNERLKRLALWLLMPANQARPRLWVKLFINPFKHRKGKGALIRPRTRIDVLPFNEFTLGEASTIEDFCTINNGVGAVRIGSRTRIGMSNVIIGPVTIGNDVMFAQHIVLSGLNHGFEDTSLPPSVQPVSTSPIVIEDEVWIGANSVVVAGVTIGKHAVVGAGSVVTKSVHPYTVVVGNPARPVKQFNQATGAWERV